MGRSVKQAGARAEAGGAGHTRGGGERSPFVGRAHELARLREAILNPPAVILVEGEAGIGKSRLVEEALATASLQGSRTLVGRCLALRDPFPLGPVVEALRRTAGAPPARTLDPVAGALRPLLPELDDVLPPTPEPVDDPAAERHRLFRAVGELLRAFGPTVCVLDDLHWADEATVELLSFLVAEVGGRSPRTEVGGPAPHTPRTEARPGLVLVLTYRPEELDPASPLVALTARLPAGVTGMRLSLSGLSAAEVRALTAAVLDVDDVPDALAGLLHERTGGIPFAVEEVARLLRDRDRSAGVACGATDVVEQLEVPRALRDSILQRVALLPPAAREVLQAAAVLGAPAAEELLAAVGDVPASDAADGVAYALAAGMLLESADGRYRLRHALLGQAILDDIARPHRRRLHARAVEALERAGDPLPLGRLAHHARGAGSVVRWVRYAEAAANAATAIGDDLTAARFLQDALQESDLDPATQVRLALSLSAAAFAAFTPDAALNALRGLLDRPLDDAERGRIRLGSALLLRQAGDVTAARSELLRAVEELRDHPTDAARAMVLLASPWTVADHVDEHHRWLERAHEAAQRGDDPVITAMVAEAQATLLLTVGDPTGWQAISDLPPAHAERGPHRKAEVARCLQLALTCLHVGHYARSKALLARAEQISGDLEHLRWTPAVQTVRSLLDWLTGCWDGLEARVRALTDDRPEVPITVTSAATGSSGRCSWRRVSWTPPRSGSWPCGSGPPGPDRCQGSQAPPRG